jgi:hypothetical protein
MYLPVTIFANKPNYPSRLNGELKVSVFMVSSNLDFAIGANKGIRVVHPCTDGSKSEDRRSVKDILGRCYTLPVVPAIRQVCKLTNLRKRR